MYLVLPPHHVMIIIESVYQLVSELFSTLHQTEQLTCIYKQTNLTTLKYRIYDDRQSAQTSKVCGCPVVQNGLAIEWIVNDMQMNWFGN